MTSSDSAALDSSRAGKVPSAPADRMLPDGDAGHRTDVDGEAHVAVDITASATDTANVALRRMAGLRAAINLPEARPEQDAQQVELAGKPFMHSLSSGGAASHRFLPAY